MNDLKIFLSDKIDQAIGRYEPCDNLVQYYGAYYDEGCIKIVMELMDIGSLRDILEMIKTTQNKPPYLNEIILSNITYQVTFQNKCKTH